MTRIFAAVAALSVCVSANAHARPVSYQGGWTVIEETDRQSTALWTHYTVTPALSLGWRTEWDRREGFVLNAPQATYLAKRWFGQNYQANIYGFAGAGLATAVDNSGRGSNAAGFVGVLTDWETRRLFVSYRARALEAGAFGASFMQAARVGYAPYEGDTGDLHTWLMIEVDHRPKNDEPVGVTPLVRFFKDAALFEIGWSVTDNQPLANFTYRF